MNAFNRVTDKDMAYFSSLMPGRVFGKDEILSDYAHDEMTEYGSFLPEAVLPAWYTARAQTARGKACGRS